MRHRFRFVAAAGAASVFLAASLASAHVRLVYPTPRYPSPTGNDNGTNIKQPPCGSMGDSRTTDMSRVTVLEPGATIEVQFTETVNHGGFYRISFDDDGQDAFVTPLSLTQIQSGPTYTLPVLLDDIDDGPAGSYTATVTLPNVTCENCTLQLIQVMTTAASWEVGDIYYTCADIALRSSGSGGMGGAGAGGAPMGGMAGGTMGGMGGTGGDTPAGAGGAPMGGMATGGMAGSTAGSGTAGAPLGGSGGSGATTAGSAPVAGMPGTAGDGSAGMSSAGQPPVINEEDGGCTCSLPPGRRSGAWAWVAAAAFALLVTRKRGSRSAEA